MILPKIGHHLEQLLLARLSARQPTGLDPSILLAHDGGSIARRDRRPAVTRRNA